MTLASDFACQFVGGPHRDLFQQVSAGLEIATFVFFIMFFGTYFRLFGEIKLSYASRGCGAS